MGKIIDVQHTPVTTRSAELIAAEINQIKDETKRKVLYNAIEIGRRLIEAKELVPHGEWGKWLQEKVDYSKTTANNLMKIFQEYGSQQITLLGDNAKSQAIGKLSYTQAVTLLVLPEEEREKLINSTDMSDISTRELKKQVEEYKKQLEDKDKDIGALENAIKEHEKWIKDEQKKTSTLEKATHESAKKINEEQQKAEKFEKEAEELKRKLDVSLQNENALVKQAKEKEKEYKQKIKELEEKAKKAPEPKNETVEDETKLKELQDAHNKELEKIRLEKAALEGKLLAAEEKRQKLEQQKDNSAFIEYAAHFNILQGEFQKLMDTLSKIKDKHTAEEYKKYLGATSKFIDLMKSRL